jgi:uncharacterized protein YegP (UPF0339 family)
MIYKIKKGRHRAFPFVLGLFYDLKAARRSVVFHEDCRYSIPGVDMLDTNKLYGIGYFWNHHNNSARFGWRYDAENGNIILVAYCYDAGIRLIKDLCAIAINQKAILSIYVYKYNYTFTVIANGVTLASQVIIRNHTKKWSFPLGFYFGGNQPAPVTMRAEIKKL